MSLRDRLNAYYYNIKGSNLINYRIAFDSRQDEVHA